MDIINKIIEDMGINLNDINDVVGKRHRPIVCMHKTNDGIVITPNLAQSPKISCNGTCRDGLCCGLTCYADKQYLDNNKTHQMIRDDIGYSFRNVTLIAEYANSGEPDFTIIVNDNIVYVLAIVYSEWVVYSLISEWIYKGKNKGK